MAASFSNSSSSISRLQGAYNSSTGLVNSLAYPNNVSANSLLLASVTWNPHSSSSTPPPPTVSDSLGNSFNLVQTAYDSPETQAWCLYYAINTKGAGADTITVSYASGTGWTGLIIDEFSGVSTSSPLDGSAVQDQQNITGGTNTLSSGSFSTSSAGDLIYASTFNVNPNISSLVPGTNFTPGVTVSSFWGTAGPFAGTEYMTQSSPGSIAGNFTTSNTAGIYAITIGAAFRAAGAVPVTYTITPTAGSNGSISPSGAVKVNSGASQTFTFTPATGYKVSSVTVDGTAVTTASSYSFSNVTANHTIGVTFSPSTFTLTAIGRVKRHDFAIGRGDGKLRRKPDLYIHPGDRLQGFKRRGRRDGSNNGVELQFFQCDSQPHDRRLLFTEYLHLNRHRPGQTARFRRRAR